MYGSIVFDRQPHCSKCGSTHPPLKHGVTMCCEALPCVGDPVQMLKIGTGPWHCCDGILQRAMAIAVSEPPRRRSRTGSVPRSVPRDREYNEPIVITSRPEVATGGYDGVEDPEEPQETPEQPQRPQATPRESEEDRRARHRAIRNVKKKLELGKIDKAEAQRRLTELGGDDV